MDVTQGEVFSPITIVIKTKEEADALWHILCCFSMTTLNTYSKDNKLPHLAVEKEGMLKDLMKVHKVVR